MKNKIYLDANIILDLLLSDRPSSQFTKEKISCFDYRTVFVINNLSLNNIFFVGTVQNKQAHTIMSFFDFIENSPKWEI